MAQSISKTFRANWQPFCLGATPFSDSAKAWQALNQRFDRLVGWPQLSRRSRLEGLYIQYSQGFPGLVSQGDVLWVDPRRNYEHELQLLYLAYLEGDSQHGRIEPAYAQGLADLLAGRIALPESTTALVGRLTGPISWGVSVVDASRRPLLHDRLLSDAVAKHLYLKARWQDEQLRGLGHPTIMMVEEPYMASYGSMHVGVGREQVAELLGQVFDSVQGLKGVHCCGNTDWSVILSTPVDIISLDAYDYGQSLTAHAEALDAFLHRGGIIAWGIAPASAVALSETANGLANRIESILARLTALGVDDQLLAASALVSPSCSLGALAPRVAESVYDLTAAVSAEMVSRLGVSAGTS